MSEHTRRHGKRQVQTERASLGEYWARYRAWVHGMSRGEKIRYRALQTAVFLSILIIVGYLILSAWIKLPDTSDLPGQTTGGQTQGDTSDLSYDGAELPQVAMSGRREGVYTFLVAGLDQVSNSTDTMLLVTYDTKNKTIDAISLLRDTMINTSATRGAQKRLNVVYTRNRGSSDLPEKERVEKGMTALKQEVSHLTGIYPDFYVLVEWEAVGELVDAIGGVYFEVPFDMDYDDPTPGQDLHIHQEAGYRLLNGQDAMEVIRFRKNNDGTHALGDSGRTAIQRDFLTAVIKECLQPDILLKLPTLAQIFTENVSTDLSVGNILAFAQLAIGMNVEENVTFVSLPWTGVSYDGASLVLANEKELLPLLNDGLNPYVGEIQSSDLQLMYKKSGGGYGVTNGTLLDSRMAKPVVAQKPQEEEKEPTEEEETPDVPPVEEPSGGAENPGEETGTGQEGDSSQGEGGNGSTGQPPDEEGETDTDTPPIVTIDPDDVLPDPGSGSTSQETEEEPPPSQDIRPS